MTERVAQIRGTVIEIVQAQFGRCEEDLLASGIVDSLTAIELALTLEREFGLRADSFALADFRSIDALVRRIAEQRTSAACPA